MYLDIEYLYTINIFVYTLILFISINAPIWGKELQIRASLHGEHLVVPS